LTLFGFEIGAAESGLGRPFAARFGDVARIDPRSWPGPRSSGLISARGLDVEIGGATLIVGVASRHRLMH
jgi:hypothetical protein